MNPLRVGLEVRQNVDSPTPKTDTSWNWPGWYEKLSLSFSSWNTALKVLVSLVSSIIFSITARFGTYGLLLHMVTPFA